jgi:hypothetical protein
MSFYRGQRVRLGEIAYRDPIIGRYGHARKGLGVLPSVGTDASVGAGIGTLLGPGGTAIGGGIGSLVGVISGLFGGGGTPDQMKAIWSTVPFSLLRLTGGHGTWTDTLTGESMSDAGSDVRKAAVVASGIGAFNDPRNWWFDQSTQQHLDGATAFQRWQQRFGGLSFANAFASYPSAFAVFGPYGKSGDPQIHSPDTPGVTGTMTTGLAPQPIPYTNVNATPYQVAAAPVTYSPAVQQAGLLGGMSTSTMLLLGGGLLVGLLLMKRGSSSSPEVS